MFPCLLKGPTFFFKSEEQKRNNEKQNLYMNNYRLEMLKCNDILNNESYLHYYPWRVKHKRLVRIAAQYIFAADPIY